LVCCSKKYLATLWLSRSRISQDEVACASMTLNNFLWLMSRASAQSPHRETQTRSNALRRSERSFCRKTNCRTTKCWTML
jgi:hypothetical protein